MKWSKPTAIQIGGIKYRIRYVKSPSKYLGDREAGAIDQHSMTIFIDKNAAPQMQLLTLVHEIMHGIAFICYNDKSHNFRENFAIQTSELIVQALQSCKLLPTVSNGSHLPHRDKPKCKK